MTVRNLTASVLAIVVIISLVSVWFYPSIQDFMRTNPFWNGLRDFSREFDVTWTDSLSDISQNPENKALIAIPYTPYNQSDLEEIDRFVQDGGLLFLLDDYGYGNTLLEQMGLQARFSGRPLLDPLFCYKNQWLPRVTDFSPALAEAGIQAIALNHGTALLGVDEDKVLAWSSESSFLDLNNDGGIVSDEQRGPFPVAAVSRFGNGTILLLSDPSILINSMVDKDNNDSFVEYLMKNYGQSRQILTDVSHLPKAPLDESKQRLSQTRERVAHPYSVVTMLGIVVLLVLGPWPRKEAG